MYRNKIENKPIYSVVVNAEEQFSTWPIDKALPHGWKCAGKSGTKEECAAYIKEAWIDMRPRSLRRKIEEHGRETRSH
jgi:MbtH protein